MLLGNFADTLASNALSCESGALRESSGRKLPRWKRTGSVPIIITRNQMFSFRCPTCQRDAPLAPSPGPRRALPELWGARSKERGGAPHPAKGGGGRKDESRGVRRQRDRTITSPVRNPARKDGGLVRSKRTFRLGMVLMPQTLLYGQSSANLVPGETLWPGRGAATGAGSSRGIRRT